MGKIIVEETANKKETKKKPAEKKVIISEVELGGIEKEEKAEVVESAEGKKAEETDEAKTLETVEKSETEEKTVAVVDANEVEKITDSADVFVEEEEVEVEEAEQPKTKASAGAKKPKSVKKSMSGMVMDFRAGASKADIKPKEDTEKKTEEAEGARKAPLSKPKSALLAVATAIIVGVIGWIVIWATGKHEASYCTVEFEPNGGTAVEEQTVACGAIIERPEDPTKDGFEFLGWMYNGEVFDFYSMRSVSGMILKARWEALPDVEIVTVKFDTDGGSEVEDISVKKGEKIKTSPITKRNGYRFLGWYQDTGEKLVKFDFSKAIDKNMTLEAMWELIPQEEPEKPAEQPATPNSPEEKVVESIEVSNIALNVGEIRSTIQVIVTPEDAKREITVSMSDSAREIADCGNSLNEGGTLTCWAIAPGEARVIVRDTKSGVFDAFKITVLPIPVQSVTIEGQRTYELEAEGTVALKATVAPSTATYKDVSWVSDNEEVAVVSGSGVVTAKAGGTATITAMAGGKSSSVTVNVKAKEPEPEKPEVEPEISGNKNMEVGETQVLQMKVGDEVKVANWSTDNAAIAEVSEDGMVTAKAAGVVRITATSDGMEAVYEITVNNGLDSGSGEPAELTFTYGGGVWYNSRSGSVV